MSPGDLFKLCSSLVEEGPRSPKLANFLARRFVARFFPRYLPFAEHFQPCSAIANNLLSAPESGGESSSAPVNGSDTESRGLPGGTAGK